MVIFIGDFRPVQRYDITSGPNLGGVGGGGENMSAMSALFVCQTITAEFLCDHRQAAARMHFICICLPRLPINNNLLMHATASC